MNNYLARLNADLIRRYGEDYELLDLEVAIDNEDGLACSGSVRHNGEIIIFNYNPNDERLSSDASLKAI